MGWVVSSTPRPHFTPRKDPVPILQEAGCAPGPVWTGGKSRPNRDSIPDRPARSQSLYRLSYPTHNVNNSNNKWITMKVSAVLSETLKSPYNTPQKSDPFEQTCRALDVTWHSDQTRPECLMSWRVIIGIIVRHLMKKCSFRDLNCCRRFRGNCGCGVLSLSPAELLGLTLFHCKRPICIYQCCLRPAAALSRTADLPWACTMCLNGCTDQRMYRYAPHNDVSVNDGPHIRRWSHKIIL